MQSKKYTGGVRFSLISLAVCSFSAPLAHANPADTLFASGFELGEYISMAGPCDGFYETGFALEEGMLNPADAYMPKPDKGVRYSDPGFSTCMVRATEHNVEPPQEFARNDYSRREPFNADDTQVLVYSSGGYWHLYDANSLVYNKQLVGPAGDAEIQWDPTDPNSLYYMATNGGMQIYKLNVTNNTHTTVGNLSGRLPWSDVERLLTKSEGSPSWDNRYWGFMAETDDFDLRGFVVYDLQNDVVVGTMNRDIMPDHVSMTPSGRWFTSSGDSDGTWAWSPDFTQKKKLHHKSEHSDIAVGPNGHDYYVSIDFETNYGDVFFTDIDACPAVPADADPDSTPMCPRTTLFESYVNGGMTSVHISGKAFAHPGWVVISTYSTTQEHDGSWPWFTNKEIAVELNGNPRIFGLGYHNGLDTGYWTENQGAVNRSMTRVMFNSNWDETSDTDVDDYMIQLPPGAIPDAIQ